MPSALYRMAPRVVRRRWSPILCALWIVATGCTMGGPAQLPSSSASGSAAVTPSALSTARSVGDRIAEILESNQFSGAGLIVREGTVLFRGGMGVRDALTGERNTAETRFKLASVYKQLSAALILTLARDGVIELDGSICQGIAECPSSLADVTYHQVLTHTSGIGELTEEESAQIGSNEDALRVIGDKQRQFAPGEGWSYSTTAYSLFSAIPEMLLGTPLVELERDRVYEPAGMPNTGLDGFDGLPAGAAVGYDVRGGAPSGDPVGNWSTVGDLCAWHDALLAGDPLPRDLVALQEQPHVDVPGGSYGYGVEIRDTDGRREVSHRGGTAGFSSFLIRFPDQDVCIALLSNVESTDVDAIREELIDVVFGAE
jgi:CubicO group peptidase (beta-lactamase class C family)